VRSVETAGQAAGSRSSSPGKREKSRSVVASVAPFSSASAAR
jgi:hypothetical protein